MVEAVKLFNSMEEHGVRPNVVIYTSLIRGFAQAKQPLMALRFYTSMRQKGIEITAASFHSVLDLIGRQLPDTAQLQEVIEEMRAASTTPDDVVYSALIKATCSAGHLESALFLVRHSRNQGHRIDEVAFNTVLLACSKEKKMPIAIVEEIFKEMCDAAAVAPSNVTSSILIKMYGRAGLLDKAVEMCEIIRREYGVAPNLHVHTCLIQACVQNKQLQRAWDMFNAMLRSGVVPDAITYGAVIHGCIYQNKLEPAMVLVRHAYMLEEPLSSSSTPGGGGGGRSPSAMATLEAGAMGRPVMLQTEVLHTLSSALRRRDRSACVAELEAILAGRVLSRRE
jgi:pentatricopeptide repeat protein